MSKPLRVVAAIFQSEGRVLACRRNPEKAAGGQWEFPGGKIETEETPEEALLRELAEELNVEAAEIGRLVSRATTTTCEATIDLACYWVKAESAPTSSTDHDKLRWSAIEELSDLDWAAPDLPAVRELQQLMVSSDTKKQEEY
ncbi:(deoxy)nucleoside triphosphate pyrophosphohydrolase [Brevibacterium marinum]|uniref:8-oxo-dGTP diphosphatase n=1 Tax=Brevibacterium marinum TaxID=418643 RepID=A0A846RXC9_9MICO|nr:(deoxy)nucleoside triphosphate pyrophosphohydrolase [Brevibacterium marinum]NJC55293.1 8-oxo-dGTP diphosphatase [Brevibacterium marinum]